MNSEFVKISSLQGLHDLSGNKNLVDFVLPQNSGSYDLSQSYINVNVSHASTDTSAVTTMDGAGAPPGVYNIVVSFAENSGRGTVVHTIRSVDSLQNKNPAVMLNHARMESSKGRIEDIRSVGAFRTNMEVYNKDYGDYSNGLGSMSSLSINNIVRAQEVNALNGEGNIISEKRSHDIRIPLKSIFASANNPVYDSNYFGFSKIHCEFKFQNLFTFDVDGKGTPLLFHSYNFGAGPKLGVMKQFVTGAAQRPANTYGTVAGDLISVNKFESLEDSPFWVGKRMGTSIAESGGAPGIANGHAQIAELKHLTEADSPGNEGCIQIILTGGFNHAILNAGNAYVVTFTDLSSGNTGLGAASGLTINNVELVAKMTPERDMNGLEYFTYEAQEDTTASGAVINRTYQLPPQTMAVYVMFPNPTYSIERLDKYRFTLNGDDVSMRAIKYNSAQHYDLVGNTFLNEGRVVKNLESLKRNINGREDDTGLAGYKEDIKVIMCPVKLSQDMTQLTIELEAEAGQTLSGKINVYSQVMKSI